MVRGGTEKSQKYPGFAIYGRAGRKDKRQMQLLNSFEFEYCNVTISFKLNLF